MSLTVENGSGLADANSYISIADADTYHEARGNTAWSDVGDEDKEAALLKATAYLQGVYAGQWKGYPTTALQALDWPRAYVERLEYAALTSASLWLESDVIPAGLSQACAELGLRALSADLSPDLGRTTIEERLGPLGVRYAPGAREQKVYQVVDGLLSRYLKGRASGMVPLVRT
jgi:hypothetical protein